MTVLLTYGHGTDSAERTVCVLREVSVVSVVDIRIAPGSRRNPQFSLPELSQWLPSADISYRWEKRLGGFRRPSEENPDVAWREPMFRGYAEYMRTAGFRDAIEPVLREAAAREGGVAARETGGETGTAAREAGVGCEAGRVAVMCSESLWWRCHRRLVADFALVACGYEVRHLMHDGRIAEHRLSPGLRQRDDGLLIYDAGQAPLL